MYFFFVLKVAYKHEWFKTLYFHPFIIIYIYILPPSNQHIHCFTSFFAQKKNKDMRLDLEQKLLYMSIIIITQKQSTLLNQLK